MDPVLERFLASLQAAGVRRVPRGRPPAGTAPAATLSVTESAPPASRATTSGSTAPLAPAPDGPAASPGEATADPAATAELFDAVLASPLARPADPAAALAETAREIEGCTLCKLCRGRTRTVPGEGPPGAAIAFVGEGPGADEDRTGRPFVGRAGRLLDDIITKGMTRRREDVFIGNVVKCRPPGNRVPEPDETGACLRYLERQLAAVAPKVICTLGATAARVLLETRQGMSRLRGGTYAWRGIPVIPTYHPAYLLRNPAAKKPTWVDIQRVMEIADR